MPALTTHLPPAVVFEDDHLLVVHKPPGWNTHAPSPYAGEGIYDWLRQREPRWSTLAIHHRLDKDTSGLLVFGKTPAANQSLSRQFEGRSVEKQYLLRSAQRPPADEFTVQTSIQRRGEFYAAVPPGSGGETAETRFRVHRVTPDFTELRAHPVTGRTHQIRVHAASEGFPILGDSLYGGAPFARLCLGAVRLSFDHPIDGRRLQFEVEPGFERSPAEARREAFLPPAAVEETDAYRRRHGAADGGAAGVYEDQLGPYRLIQAEHPVAWPTLENSAGGVYFRRLNRQVRRTQPTETSPQFVAGSPAPERFLIRENGVRFELSFTEGYSVGLFLDQRDNRRRLLTNHVGAQFPALDLGTGPREVLNAFAYTCGFSVCAACAGARTTSLDLSRKYLDWGRRNFVHNHLSLEGHDFIYGDCFDWFRRLARKGRRFDVILLDPPTFSRSREHGDFRAEQDLGKLVSAALPLLRAPGTLFVSTNAARLEPEGFLHTVRQAVGPAGRKIRHELYIPQPPDFPISREEPAYLKTVWLTIE